MYLEAMVGFSKAELAGFIATMGLASIAAQTVFFALLTRHFAQRTVILVGLVFLAGQLTVFGAASSLKVLFANAVPVALGSITYPALSSLLAHTAKPEEQGAIQGMATGIRALCSGLGPILFSSLFQLAGMDLGVGPVDPVTSLAALDALPDAADREPDPDEPHRTAAPPSLAPGAGMPFFVGAALVAVAAVLCLTLDPRTAGKVAPASPRAGDESIELLHVPPDDAAERRAGARGAGSRAASPMLE